MNEIKVFQNPEFGTVRTIFIDNQPYFIGKEVCTILGYSNGRDALAKHVDDEDKGVAKCDTPGGIQELVVINESGLYSLILSSKLPTARRFKRWVTSEVLPSIRRHGMYATPTTIEAIIEDPDSFIKVLQDLKQERAKRLEAERKNKENEPKVFFAESVANAKNDILVGELAKIMKQNGMETGQNRLYEKLREDGFIMKNKREPTQKAMDMGLFRVVERTIDTPDGTRLTRTTKVTGKGQLYFINKYVKKQKTISGGDENGCCMARP